MPVRSHEEHGVRRRPRVAVRHEQLRPDRQRGDRRREAGHQAGAHPVPPVPDPGARGDEDDEEPAPPQLVAQRHRRAVGRGHRDVLHGPARLGGGGHVVDGHGRGVHRLRAQRAAAQMAVGQE